MTRLGEHGVHSPVDPAEGSAAGFHGQWTEGYGPLVADQLRPDGRYTLMRVGEAEFAYTGFDLYLRALGQAWEAGLVPEPLPTTCGRDLLGVAPNLQGVDLDLGELAPGDVEPARGRFSQRR